MRRTLLHLSCLATTAVNILSACTINRERRAHDMGSTPVGDWHDCQGKKRLPSPQLAWRVLLRPQRTKRGYRVVYRCLSCGSWHLGSDPLGKHKQYRKAKLAQEYS